MPDLFSPLRLRELELSNRIAVSPMQQYITPNGIVGDWHLVHLGSRAVGGAGLIIAESTAVSPEGRATKEDTGIWNDQQAKSWQKTVDFVHQQGSKIAIQLGHFGSKGSRNHPREGFVPIDETEGGWKTVSSSAVAPFKGLQVPDALDHAGIERVQKAFVNAAKRAVDVGFDSIELHAAHGYLFHQFYSELINHRTDDYGGSFENRIRFLVQTAEKVRAVIPERMPLLTRISAVDHVDDPKAWNLENSVALCQQLKRAGVDLVTASAGGFSYLPKEKVSQNYQVPYAEAIKKRSGITTGAVGLITDARQAQQIIQKEQADLVVIAREFLRNPYFPLQAAQELEQEITYPEPYLRGF